MRQFTPLLAAGAMILTTAPAAADLGDQLFKLLPDDGEEADHFGISVAISGTTAIIGADSDNDNGNYSGSAYLFDATTGEQLAKLLAEDGESGDNFGRSVGISGTTAIIGAHADTDNGWGAGSAYIFDAASGEQLFKLLAYDGEEFDYFGRSVAISGSTAIVGADGDEDNGYRSGAAYLFDTATGQELFKLHPNDGAEEDHFGRSVGISGTIAIVGSWLDDDNGDRSGSAYLFDTTTGQQIAKLLASDGEEKDEFGLSVAISGTTAIVGAYKHDDNGPNSGAAYLFDTTTGKQIAELLPNDGAKYEWFGVRVAIDGDTAIISAYLDDKNGIDSGAVYLFDVATGQQIAKILPDDGAKGDLFGYSVAIEGDTAVVGALSDDDNGSSAGSAYIFDANMNAFPVILESCSITFGSTDNPPCEVANLLDDDDIDQILRSQFGFSAFERNLTEIVINGSGADATSVFSIETRDGSDTTNVVAKVKARNYVSNLIDDIAQYDVSFPSNDTAHTTFVASADYIDANGDVELRLRYVAPATFTPVGFTVGLDQVVVMVE